MESATSFSLQTFTDTSLPTNVVTRINGQLVILNQFSRTIQIERHILLKFQQKIFYNWHQVFRSHSHHRQRLLSKYFQSWYHESSLHHKQYQIHTDNRSTDIRLTMTNEIIPNIPNISPKVTPKLALSNPALSPPQMESVNLVVVSSNSTTSEIQPNSSPKPITKHMIQSTTASAPPTAPSSSSSSSSRRSSTTNAIPQASTSNHTHNVNLAPRRRNSVGEVPTPKNHNPPPPDNRKPITGYEQYNHATIPVWKQKYPNPTNILEKAKNTPNGFPSSSGASVTSVGSSSSSKASSKRSQVNKQQSGNNGILTTTVKPSSKQIVSRRGSLPRNEVPDNRNNSNNSQQSDDNNNDDDNNTVSSMSTTNSHSTWHSVIPNTTMIPVHHLQNGSTNNSNNNNDNNNSFLNSKRMQRYRIRNDTGNNNGSGDQEQQQQQHKILRQESEDSMKPSVLPTLRPSVSPTYSRTKQYLPLSSTTTTATTASVPPEDTNGSNNTNITTNNSSNNNAVVGNRLSSVLNRMRQTPIVVPIVVPNAVDDHNIMVITPRVEDSNTENNELSKSSPSRNSASKERRNALLMSNSKRVLSMEQQLQQEVEQSIDSRPPPIEIPYPTFTVDEEEDKYEGESVEQQQDDDDEEQHEEEQQEEEGNNDEEDGKTVDSKLKQYFYHPGTPPSHLHHKHFISSSPSPSHSQPTISERSSDGIALATGQIEENTVEKQQEQQEEEFEEPLDEEMEEVREEYEISEVKTYVIEVNTSPKRVHSHKTIPTDRNEGKGIEIEVPSVHTLETFDYFPVTTPIPINNITATTTPGRSFLQDTNHNTSPSPASPPPSPLLPSSTSFLPHISSNAIILSDLLHSPDHKIQPMRHNSMTMGFETQPYEEEAQSSPPPPPPPPLSMLSHITTTISTKSMSTDHISQFQASFTWKNRRLKKYFHVWQDSLIQIQSHWEGIQSAQQFFKHHLLVSYLTFWHQYALNHAAARRRRRRQGGGGKYHDNKLIIKRSFVKKDDQLNKSLKQVSPDKLTTASLKVHSLQVHTSTSSIDLTKHSSSYSVKQQQEDDGEEVVEKIEQELWYDRKSCLEYYVYRWHVFNEWIQCYHVQAIKNAIHHHRKRSLTIGWKSWYHAYYTRKCYWETKGAQKVHLYQRTAKQKRYSPTKKSSSGITSLVEDLLEMRVSPNTAVVETISKDIPPATTDTPPSVVSTSSLPSLTLAVKTDPIPTIASPMDVNIVNNNSSVIGNVVQRLEDKVPSQELLQSLDTLRNHSIKRTQVGPPPPPPPPPIGRRHTLTVISVRPPPPPPPPRQQVNVKIDATTLVETPKIESQIETKTNSNVNTLALKQSEPKPLPDMSQLTNTQRQSLELMIKYRNSVQYCQTTKTLHAFSHWLEYCCYRRMKTHIHSVLQDYVQNHLLQRMFSGWKSYVQSKQQLQ